jgi:galactokinase
MSPDTADAGAPVTPTKVRAFAPGRVNLIGEHTDYNLGLALPFAIAEGITVQAGACHGETVRILADDLGESDEFALRDPEPAQGWRAFARGMVAELRGAGVDVPGAEIRFAGDVRPGSGLSSSAALEVALCLALLALSDAAGTLDRLALARLCSRVENDWVGARTGLLDQLASLYGAPDTALAIDFRTLEVEPVPLRLHGWSLATLDSGERHVHASSGYNERREECARACELLGVKSLRDAPPGAESALPEPLARRVRHVLSENARVLAAREALIAGDLIALGELLDASHASLRDDYEISTPAVELAREQLRRAGCAGARLIGGGFGGSVLGLFPPDAGPPAQAHPVTPGAGARLLD